MTGMTSIEYVTLEVADPTAAERFYTTACGFGPQVRLRASNAPTSGFRAFTLSLVVSQPATVDTFVRAALDAGAALLKPAQKQFWGGYSGVVRAPDGTIWKVATSSKKNTGPATREINEIVLLLASRMLPRANASTSTAAWRWQRASPARTSSSPPRQCTSSLACTSAEPWPRTPASPRTAPERTASPFTAMLGPSPTRTDSRGKPASRSPRVMPATGALTATIPDTRST